MCGRNLCAKSLLYAHDHHLPRSVIPQYSAFSLPAFRDHVICHTGVELFTQVKKVAHGHDIYLSWLSGCALTGGSCLHRPWCFLPGSGFARILDVVACFLQIICGGAILHSCEVSPGVCGCNSTLLRSRLLSWSRLASCNFFVSTGDQNWTSGSPSCFMGAISHCGFS